MALYYAIYQQKCDKVCIHFDTILALDRETDGQTDAQKRQNNIAHCMHSMLMRDKKRG